jgi:transcriptional regulator with XRE-family HTH domain
MGRASRPKPRRLARKLREVRKSLAVSQEELARLLKSPEEINRNYISGYERGTREPSLLTLLAYSRLSGIAMEQFVDDRMSLPGNPSDGKVARHAKRARAVRTDKEH